MVASGIDDILVDSIIASGKEVLGNDKTSDSQMNPCKTCQTFEYEYMKHANKGKGR